MALAARACTDVTAKLDDQNRRSDGVGSGASWKNEANAPPSLVGNLVR
jgi:hypothetical protein